MSGFLGFLEILGFIAAYFAPAITALARKPPHRGSVIVVNVFAGWTVIGWIVALAMACRSKRTPVVLPPPPGWAAGPGYSGPPAR
jgi:uncharacterized membrane protein HdeD (DUF308 family)